MKIREAFIGTGMLVVGFGGTACSAEQAVPAATSASTPPLTTFAPAPPPETFAPVPLPPGISYESASTLRYDDPTAEDIDLGAVCAEDPTASRSFTLTTAEDTQSRPVRIFMGTEADKQYGPSRGTIIRGIGKNVVEYVMSANPDNSTITDVNVFGSVLFEMTAVNGNSAEVKIAALDPVTGDVSLAMNCLPPAATATSGPTPIAV